MVKTLASINVSFFMISSFRVNNIGNGNSATDVYYTKTMPKIILNLN